MSVEKYEKDEQIKKVRPMNTGREGEIWLGGCAQLSLATLVRLSLVDLWKNNTLAGMGEAY